MPPRRAESLLPIDSVFHIAILAELTARARPGWIHPEWHEHADGSAPVSEIRESDQPVVPGMGHGEGPLHGADAFELTPEEFDGLLDGDMADQAAP